MAYLFRFGVFIVFISTLISKEKWVVITSIQYPTEAVKAISKMKDWQLIVIGDKKTPVDWSLENCIYLSPEDQEKLPYKTAKISPWNHYARKNIGYLYAIDHGAKIIYETDDDNIPLDGIKFFKDSNKNLICTEDLFFNVCSYFGRPDIWPRGFPLNYILKNNHNMTQKESLVKASIEQGFVNGNPDVDAIFRLTRNSEQIYFDTNKLPCILDKNVFCPFNTQNTLFYKDAFFLMYIPVTVAFRACDIWRGYFAQRILWGLDKYLCFTPPTAFQDRNAHDLLKDFIGEQEIYYNTERLTSHLLNWKYNKSCDPLRNLYFLYESVCAQKIIDYEELKYIEAWIEDLMQIGGCFE